MTAAHRTTETFRIEFNYPAHEPREDDPHYHVFNETRRRLKRLGALKCWIDNSDCRGDIELHHSLVEFSLANVVDVDQFRALYPEFHIESDDAFLDWINSEGNLLPLCLEEFSPVFMADGSVKSIADIKVDDYVMGADGKSNRVSATSRKEYSGSLWEVAPNVWATPEHPVLTRRGWVPARALRDTDLLYTVPNDGMGSRVALNLRVPEMHDVVPTFDEEVISHLVKFNTVGVPFPSVHFNDKVEAWEVSVNRVSADIVIRNVLHSIRDQQGVKPILNARRVMSHRTASAVRRVFPRTFTGAVFPGVLLPTTFRRTTCLAGDGKSRSAGKAVQDIKTAGIGAKFVRSIAFTLSSLKRLSAMLAGQVEDRQLLVPTTYDGTTFPRTGLIAVLKGFGDSVGFRTYGACLNYPCLKGGDSRLRPTINNTFRDGNGSCLGTERREQFSASRGAGKYSSKSRCPDDEWRGANFANTFDTRIKFGAGIWVQANALRRKDISKVTVRDIAVESSHSFLANGLLVHNCAFHHRGVLGIHSIHYPGWVVQRFMKDGVAAPERRLPAVAAVRSKK